MKAIQFLSELSTDLLARYKKAAYSDAKKADAEGDYERGNKRFKGINKATNKQFDNDLKKHDVEEGGAWHSTPQSAMIGINGKKTNAKSASDSKRPEKSFTYQGHTIKFSPNKREIYKGPTLLHSKEGDYSNPTKLHLSTAHGDVSRLMAKKEGIFDSKPKVDFKARAKELFASGLTEQQVLQQLIKEGCPPRQAAVFVQGAQLESISEWLAEEGKASRALCQGGKPDSQLGASQLASCKSQGLRARDGEKSHLIGKGGSKVRVTVGGKKIKGKKYGGPLPDYGTRKGQQ
jgi:hypothetical protein